MSQNHQYMEPPLRDFSSDDGGSEPKFQLDHADFWTRVWASLLDFLILLSGIIIAAVIISSIFETTQDIESSTFFKIIVLVFYGIYHVAFVCSPWQGTPGKRIVGIMITNNRYQRLGPVQATWRHIASYANNLILGIGYLFPLFNDKKQTLHDMLAVTYVVIRPKQPSNPTRNRVRRSSGHKT